MHHALSGSRVPRSACGGSGPGERSGTERTGAAVLARAPREHRGGRASGDDERESRRGQIARRGRGGDRRRVRQGAPRRRQVQRVHARGAGVPRSRGEGRGEGFSSGIPPGSRRARVPPKKTDVRGSVPGTSLFASWRPRAGARASDRRRDGGARSGQAMRAWGEKAERRGKKTSWGCGFVARREAKNASASRRGGGRRGDGGGRRRPGVFFSEAPARRRRRSTTSNDFEFEAPMKRARRLVARRLGARAAALAARGGDAEQTVAVARRLVRVGAGLRFVAGGVEIRLRGVLGDEVRPGGRAAGDRDEAPPRVRVRVRTRAGGDGGVVSLRPRGGRGGRLSSSSSSPASRLSDREDAAGEGFDTRVRRRRGAGRSRLRSRAASLCSREAGRRRRTRVGLLGELVARARGEGGRAGGRTDPERTERTERTERPSMMSPPRSPSRESSAKMLELRSQFE